MTRNAVSHTRSAAPAHHPGPRRPPPSRHRAPGPSARPGQAADHDQSQRALGQGPQEAPGPQGGFRGGKPPPAEAEDQRHHHEDGPERCRRPGPRESLGVGPDHDVGPHAGQDGEGEVHREQGTVPLHGPQHQRRQQDQGGGDDGNRTDGDDLGSSSVAPERCGQRHHGEHDGDHSDVGGGAHVERGAEPGPRRRSVEALEEDVHEVARRERLASSLRAPHRGGQQLGAREQQRRSQRGTGDRPHHQVDDGADDGSRLSEPPGPQHEQGGDEHHEGGGQQHQGVGLAGVDRHGHDQGQDGDRPPMPLSPHHEEGGREQPSRPGEHRRHGPTQPTEERPAQLVHGGGHGAPEHPEAQDPTQHVGAGPGDDQGHQHLDGVGEVEGEQVSHQGGQAERGGLPVERQGHPERAVGIPQRQLSVMDLGPRQRRPRDHLGDLVEGLAVVDHHPGLRGQAVARQPVEGPERRTVGERRREHGTGRRQHPQQTEQVPDLETT